MVGGGTGGEGMFEVGRLINFSRERLFKFCLFDHLLNMNALVEKQ